MKIAFSCLLTDFFLQVLNIESVEGWDEDPSVLLRPKALALGLVNWLGSALSDEFPSAGSSFSHSNHFFRQSPGCVDSQRWLRLRHKQGHLLWPHVWTPL